MATKSTRTYYFLKAADGRYLQAQANFSTGTYSFWLDAKRALTPCCETREQAEQYRNAAEAQVGNLGIAQEAL